MSIVLVRTLEPDGAALRARYQYRHTFCVDDGEHVESWGCHPLQPNRHDYGRDEDFERALTEQWSCGRCGLPLSNVGGSSGDGSGSAPGAGDIWGAGHSSALAEDPNAYREL